MKSTRNWYRVESKADDPTIADIHIVDFIGDWIDDYWGFGVTAKSFIDQLSKLADQVSTIRVHINSPGGDVFSALNIANALREQAASKGRTVETVVDGLAASAATIIMMAGSVVRIADNGMVMVHNPWTVAVGNAADMRKLADDMDKIRNTIVATYKWHSSLSDEDLIALMDAETWMDADEAVTNGFATEKVEGLKAAATLDARAVAKLKVPEKFRDRVAAMQATPAAAPSPAATADVLRLCRVGGCLELAETLVAENATIDQVNARIADNKQQKAAAKSRADAITGICATAKLPELAAGYIAGAMTEADVRAHVTTITARMNMTEIDASLHPDGGTVARAAFNLRDSYDKLNGVSSKKE